MKTLTFAVLFLSMGPFAGAQQVTLLENGAKVDASTAAAAGMPQVLIPKEDAAPVPAGTAAPAAFPFEAVKPEEMPAAAMMGETPAVKPAEAVKPAAAAPAAKPAEKAAPTPAAVKPAVVQAPPAVKGAGFAVAKTHTVTGGDTLWDLSNKYYKDPYKWGKIYNANLSTVANPDLIYPREELVIPDLTEEVTPAGAKAPEITGGETVKEAEFTGTDVKQQEGASAAAPAAPAKAAKAELGDMLRDYDATDLSEEMPGDQKEWSTAISIVPDSWTEDGVITAAEKGKEESMEDSMSEAGAIVEVSMTGGAAVKKDDYLEVYLKGANAFDKSGKRLGREMQQAGTLQVLSSEGRQARARVVEAATGIIKGYVVKKK